MLGFCAGRLYGVFGGRRRGGGRELILRSDAKRCFKKAQICKLFGRRSEWFITPRLVPCGNSSAGALIVITIHRARIETQSFQRLLQLLYVGARCSGRDVAIRRRRALKN